MKSKFELLVFSLAFTTGCLTFHGCSNEEEIPSNYIAKSEYGEYLFINGYPTKTAFSPEEKRILKEALCRVTQHIAQDENGIYINNTAEELNMSYDIYADFMTLIELGNKQGTKIHRIRKRTEIDWNIDPCGWAQEYVNEYLEDTDGGDFSQECFNNYWSGTGDNMSLSDERFEDITKYVEKPTSTMGMTSFKKNGKTYYQLTNDFYDTPYALSLGNATVIYDSKMNPVGLSDTYDFNPMSWGDRDIDKEAMTRAVFIAGNICGAEDFDILYGVTP